jgi:hypothetical protein
VDCWSGSTGEKGKWTVKSYSTGEKGEWTVGVAAQERMGSGLLEWQHRREAGQLVYILCIGGSRMWTS